MKTTKKDYFIEKDKKVEELVDRIEMNKVNFNELDDDILNELISYYTIQISNNKKEINNIKNKVKGKK